MVLFPTTIVGSLPQPDWLIDRAELSGMSPPRSRVRELWRINEAYLEQAQDDATLLAIQMQERAGLDVLTDGEVRRESYANRFTTTLEGLDTENPGIAPSRTGRPNLVPRVVGPVRRVTPVLVRDVQLLRANTDHQIKITIPGPFTMAHQVMDEFYGDKRTLALALAAAVNDELKDLAAAGADVVQIDEPLLQAWPEEAQAYAIEAINRALEGVTVTTALHTCFGYGHIIADRPDGYPFLAELSDCSVQQLSLETAQLQLKPPDLAVVANKQIILGVIDIVNKEVESPEVVATRIRSVLPYVAADHILPSTDCGMKYLSREVSMGKLRSLVEGARIVRDELGSR